MGPPCLLLFAVPFIPNPQSLQLPVQGGPFHPDERRGPRDVAGETSNLNLQILALEGFARFTKRTAHDRHGRARSRTDPLVLENFGRKEIDIDAGDPIARLYPEVSA